MSLKAFPEKSAESDYSGVTAFHGRDPAVANKYRPASFFAGHRPFVIASQLGDLAESGLRDRRPTGRAASHSWFPLIALTTESEVGRLPPSPPPSMAQRACFELKNLAVASFFPDVSRVVITGRLGGCPSRDDVWSCVSVPV